jgi:pimeloyl-ACP methyl ester carboxylesterase
MQGKRRGKKYGLVTETTTNPHDGRVASIPHAHVSPQPETLGSVHRITNPRRHNSRTAHVQILVVALLSLVTAGVFYQWSGSRRGARVCAAPGRLVEVNGRRLHVVTAGSTGPSVILESGIAASSLTWAHVQPRVAAFARVCAYDRAGLGWSDPDPRRRTLSNIVGDLDAVIDRTSMPPPYVLVGHSFGCFVVCAFAARYPARVGGLVLLDPPAASEWREPSPRQARLLARGIRLSRLGGLMARIGVVRACLALLTGGAPGVPGTLIKGLGPVATAKLMHLVKEVRKLPAGVHAMVQEHWCQPKCFRAMADHLRVLQEAAAFVVSLDRLPDVPLVVISSGEVPPDRIDEHRQLARLSSTGRHVVAARSGHWIPFDEPELVVEAVRETGTLDASRRVDTRPASHPPLFEKG